MLQDHCPKRTFALRLLFSFIFLSLFAHREQQYTPFGALQVRPVTQEVWEEAVKLLYIWPQDAISRRKHTLEQTSDSSY